MYQNLSSIFSFQFYQPYLAFAFYKIIQSPISAHLHSYVIIFHFYPNKFKLVEVQMAWLLFVLVPQNSFPHVLTDSSIYLGDFEIFSLCQALYFHYKGYKILICFNSIIVRLFVCFLSLWKNQSSLFLQNQVFNFLF
jgi:hypothetical protein